MSGRSGVDPREGLCPPRDGGPGGDSRRRGGLRDAVGSAERCGRSVEQGAHGRRKTRAFPCAVRGVSAGEKQAQTLGSEGATGERTGTEPGENNDESLDQKVSGQRLSVL